MKPNRFHSAIRQALPAATPVPRLILPDPMLNGLVVAFAILALIDALKRFAK